MKIAFPGITGIIEQDFGGNRLLVNPLLRSRVISSREDEESPLKIPFSKAPRQPLDLSLIMKGLESGVEFRTYHPDHRLCLKEPLGFSPGDFSASDNQAKPA
jgi:hypothetical protein